MSENTNKPEQKSSNQIQQEYAQLCTKAGALQFEIESKKKDVVAFNARLAELQLEYVAAKNFEAEVAKKVAEENSKTKEETAPPALSVVETPKAAE